eukprot:2218633-Pleurochrysis_carterae.AAC.1
MSQDQKVQVRPEPPVIDTATKGTQTVEEDPRRVVGAAVRLLYRHGKDVESKETVGSVAISNDKSN